MEWNGAVAVLVFVGVPLGLAAVIAGWVYTADAVRRSRDAYRPGRPWTFPPVWLVSSEADEIETPTVEGKARGDEALDKAARDAPVPGPLVVRARLRRSMSVARQGSAMVVQDSPGGARGSW